MADMNYPRISVIIPTYGEVGVGLTRRCLQSLFDMHYFIRPAIQAIVVQDGDDGGIAASLQAVCEDYQAHLIVKPRGGFAKACNAGLEVSNGEIVYFCNNDIEFVDPCLQFMTDFSMSVGGGILGCRLLYPDGTVQHGGVVWVENPGGIPVPGYFDHLGRGAGTFDPGVTATRNCLLSGALLGVSRHVLSMIGGFDERYEFTCEDIDLCLRGMDAGVFPTYLGFASAIHHEGATRGRTPQEKLERAPEVAEAERRSIEFLYRRWVGMDWRIFTPQGPSREIELP